MSKNNSFVVAYFRSPHAILSAAKKAKANNYNFETYTPFPIHGMDDAMGLERSNIPFVTFTGAVLGGTGILALMLWTHGVDWPMIIGGKPYFAIPAAIPITFEGTILIAGISTFLALFFYFCGLPEFSEPFHPDITNDRFALVVTSESGDKNKQGEIESFLKNVGGYEVSTVQRNN